MSGWQTMESAPLDETVVEGINRSMQMPVDMCYGVYRLIIGGIVDRDEAGWHIPHYEHGRMATIFPDFWRPKTTDDKLTLFRPAPLVEWPPLPEQPA